MHKIAAILSTVAEVFFRLFSLGFYKAARDLIHLDAPWHLRLLLDSLGCSFAVPVD